MKIKIYKNYSRFAKSIKDFLALAQILKATLVLTLLISFKVYPLEFLSTKKTPETKKTFVRSVACPNISNCSIHKDNDNPNRVLGFQLDTKGFPERKYTFKNENQNQDGCYLEIWDAESDKNRVSQTAVSQIHFYPKVTRPELIVQNGQLRAILPTNESIFFDFNSKRVMPHSAKYPNIKSVVSEESISNSRTPKMKYLGKGLIVRVSGGGGKDVKYNNPVIEYNGKVCSNLTPRDIWKYNVKNEPTYSKFNTSEEFYRFVETKCNWNLNPLRQFENKLIQKMKEAKGLTSRSTQAQQTAATVNGRDDCEECKNSGNNAIYRGNDNPHSATQGALRDTGIDKVLKQYQK